MSNANAKISIKKNNRHVFYDQRFDANCLNQVIAELKNLHSKINTWLFHNNVRSHIARLIQEFLEIFPICVKLLKQPTYHNRFSTLQF